MLAQSHARKPAPPLAARGMWLRLHGGPDAFGSALGDTASGKIAQIQNERAQAKLNAEIDGYLDGVLDWPDANRGVPDVAADGPVNMFGPFSLSDTLPRSEGVPSLADEFDSNASERPGPYKVRGGDTLTSIADGDKAMMGRYISGSNLKDPNKIRTGQTLTPNWDMSDDDAITLANRFYAADGKAKDLARQAAAASARNMGPDFVISGSISGMGPSFGDGLRRGQLLGGEPQGRYDEPNYERISSIAGGAGAGLDAIEHARTGVGKSAATSILGRAAPLHETRIAEIAKSGDLSGAMKVVSANSKSGQAMASVAKMTKALGPLGVAATGTEIYADWAAAPANQKAETAVASTASAAVGGVTVAGAAKLGAVGGFAVGGPVGGVIGGVLLGAGTALAYEFAGGSNSVKDAVKNLLLDVNEKKR